MVSQQQKAAKGKGKNTNGMQGMRVEPSKPSTSVAQVAVRPDDVEQVEANYRQNQTPTKLSVPDDTVSSSKSSGATNTTTTTSMNEVEISENGEIVSANEGREATTSKTRKRRKKKYRELLVDASEVMPRPSVWPIVLAFSIAVMLFGLIWNAVILIIGFLLIIASIIGWAVEKREHTFKTAVPVKNGTRSDKSDTREDDGR